MPEITQQGQPEGSSTARRRRAARKNSTVFSVRKCGTEYEVRISRSFVKVCLIPLVSGLIGIGAGNADWGWIRSESPQVSGTAADPAPAPAPVAVDDFSRAAAESKDEARREKDHGTMNEG